MLISRTTEIFEKKYIEEYLKKITILVLKTATIVSTTENDAHLHPAYGDGTIEIFEELLLCKKTI